MVRYLTPGQSIMHNRFLKTNEKHSNGKSSKGKQHRNFSIDKMQSIEKNKANNNSSKSHNQILCSICKRSDKIVTDSESGEIICSNCGMVISDKIEDTS